MEYIEFRAKLAETLSSMLEEGEEVHLRQVSKNNGIVYDGITVRIPGSNISPTLDIEDIKKQFEREETDFKSEAIAAAAEEILKICRVKSISNHELEEKLWDYSNFREQVCFRLVNRESNRARLQDMPYHPILDLAMIYYYRTDVIGELEGSVLIHNSDLGRWGVTEEELFQDASHNTPLLEPIKTMTFFENDDGYGMRVYTNANGLYGAGVMFYEGAFLEDAERWQQNLYILPSSIHEVLAVPEWCSPSVEDLKNMVREVNDTVVADTEILSNEVYVRNYADGEIAFA